jgi:hypothetical protein
MKNLAIVLAGASLLATTAVAAPAAAQCGCAPHHRVAHRVVHRVVRHAAFRHVRTRVVIREVVRPVYVDRPVYPHYRPQPVIDEGRYVEGGPWVGPPVRPRWGHHHHRHDVGPVRYERHWHGDDDWRRIAIVRRF